jgi:hypothetical protein
VRIQPLPFGNGKDGSDLTLCGSRDFDAVRVAIAVIGVTVGRGLQQTACRTVASFNQAAIGRPTVMRLTVAAIAICMATVAGVAVIRVTIGWSLCLLFCRHKCHQSFVRGPLQFIVYTLASQSVQVLNTISHQSGIIQDSILQLNVEMDTGSTRAIIGLTDFAAQPNVEFHGHRVSLKK